MAAVDPARPVEISPTGVAPMATAVIDLLTALDDGPTPVADLAAKVSSAIHLCRYEPGMALVTASVAADLDAPKELTRLALAQLVGEGLLTRAGSRTTVALSGSRPFPRPEHLAARLREQIAQGIYPSGVNLPGLNELARRLNTVQPRIAEAQRLLEADGLLLRQRRRGPAVLEPARLLTSPDRLPLPDPPARRIPLHAVQMSAGAASNRWHRRAYLPPAEVHMHWQSLRDIGAQLLDTPFPNCATSGARARANARATRAMEALCAPLPDGILPGLWHTACLSTALRDLLPPSGSNRGR
ncbi:GntR family transcriptional regulator [Streptomyces lavendulae]|uniref:GntR family transcriptional regulator n=1 Tax=Streptomyces lavendulae TaxID=1914 RepID=UPI00381648D3